MYAKETKVIDKLTGEIFENTAFLQNTKQVKGESFINVYLNDMSGLMNIKTQTELKILA